MARKFKGAKNAVAVLAALSLLLVLLSAQAGELVLAQDGSSSFQIVLPDKNSSEIVARWLEATAKLIQAAFDKNGFKVAIVKESVRAQDKPCLYLGATEFAKKNSAAVLDRDDWTYQMKVVGKDLIIAGTDKADPKKTIRGTKTPLALLGTVKGVCDFLREYAGVRFLFLNMDNSLYATLGDGGPLQELDMQSIAFLPMKRIAVPDDLSLTKTPMMRANSDQDHESLQHIALNFFPMLSFVKSLPVEWASVFPAEKYAKTHPEYYALLADGKRCVDWRTIGKLGACGEMLPPCVTNADVQDLMVKAIEERIKDGFKVIPLGVIDFYGVCRCNCDKCIKLFGMPARNLDEIRARAASGKFWPVPLAIAKSVHEKYPDVKIVLQNYQDTPVNAQVIQRFPDYVILDYQYASQWNFDKLKGVEIPGGICSGLEETFTGFGAAGPYLAERTPKHMAEVVQAQACNHVLWSTRDGALGYVRGMQAPAYYVYGRMMDDPTADWKEIYKEFNMAAFGSVAPQMTKFFNLLDSQIAIYSDFLGVYMPGWGPEYSMYPESSRFHDSKWYVMSMYPPEYCAAADATLTAAEQKATDPNIKARLHLIRIDFDYARWLSKIFFIQNAWTINPSQENLTALMAAIDGWHDWLKNMTTGTGRLDFKPLNDWPRMRPFNGHFYALAALEYDQYRQQWAGTCLNWDTKAIRDGFLADKRHLKVATVEEAPGIDAKAWDNAAASVFAESGKMPFTNVKTTMKVLRDNGNLYVRIDSLYPDKHLEELFEQKPDGDIFKQEHIELAIAPQGAGDKVYRLAAGPVKGARYDAILSDKGSEDKNWNGTWVFEYKVNMPKGPWNLGARIWTAWFKIPFAEFGTRAPSAGDVWRFNAARNRVDKYLLWKGAPKATDRGNLGELIF